MKPVPALISILFFLSSVGSNLSHANAFWAEAEDQSELSKRIINVSDTLLGRPYRSSPLGEGTGTDPDPLLRYDAFDCTTYVETVGAMALAGASDSSRVQPLLNEIRYVDGVPNFVHRNHFISLDWLPHNARKKIVKDLTQEIWPQNFRVIKTWIDKKNWFQTNFGINFEQSPVLVPFNVILIRDLLEAPELLKSIPQSSVISLVRNRPSIKRRIGTDLDVGHLGFAIWKDGKLKFRHAKGFQEGVIEEDFLAMLKSSYMADKYALNVSIFLPDRMMKK